MRAALSYIQSGLCLFVCGFIIPFAIIIVLHTYRVPVATGHYGFGWEMGRVGVSLATGQGFSSPYPQATGPTAILPPIYPLLIAVVFKAFGVYSSASSLCLLLFNCLFHAMTCLTIVRLGSITMGRVLGILGGWLWCVNPYAVYVASTRAWDTQLTTLLLTMIVLMTLRLSTTTTIRRGFSYGALSAVGCLTNPTVLLLEMLLWTWAAWRLKKVREDWRRFFIAVFCGFTLLVMPWELRNYRIFHRIIPIRSNFWMEARVGNCLGHVPSLREKDDYYEWYDWQTTEALQNERFVTMTQLPSVSKSENQKLLAMSEIKYMQQNRTQAVGCIEDHPENFVLMTLRRIAFTWTGALYLWPVSFLRSHTLQFVAIAVYSTVSAMAFGGMVMLARRSQELASLYAIPILFLPLTYYLTHTTLRYRLPIDPEVILLLSFFLISILKELKTSGHLRDLGCA